MELTAAQLAQLLGGTLEGDGSRRLSTIAKIEEAGPDAVAFLSNPKYEPYLYSTQAGAVLIRQDLELTAPVSATLIRVANPYSAFTQLLEQVERLRNQVPPLREQPSFVAEGVDIPADAYIGAFAYIGAGTKLGAGVKIYPNAYIGPNCQIGEGTIVYAGARLYADTVVGARCVIHAGVVIGSDGFGHAPQADGSYRKIPHLGSVVLGDEVEVGANTVIDRATLGLTRIGNGVKLDNLIQIAHNVEVGANTVMAAQVGISGSTKIGANAQLGGQVGIAGHLTLADGVKLGAKTGVMSSIAEEGAQLMGAPAMELRQFFRVSAIFRNLPQLAKRLDALEKQVARQGEQPPL